MSKSPSASSVVERVSTERRRSRAPLLLATVAGTTALLGAASVATFCRFPEIWRDAPSAAVFRVQSRSMEPSFLGPRFVWCCPKCGDSFATTIDVDSSGGVRSFDDAGEKAANPDALILNADSPEVRKFRTTARFFPCPRCGFDRVPASSAVFQDGALVEATAVATSETFKTQTSASASVKNEPNLWNVWSRRLKRVWSGAAPVLRPERWDVVVFRAPTGRATLKRVVGLPGETIEIVNGDVFVDGRVAPRSLKQIAATATRLDSTQICRSDARLSVVATTPIWNDAPSPDAPDFPQTVFKPTPIFNESPTPRWNGDDVAPLEPVRDFLFDFSWSNADGTPTRFQLLARRPKRVFLLDFDEETQTVALRSAPLVDGRTSAGRPFDELTASDFADASSESVRWNASAPAFLTDVEKPTSRSSASTKFRVYLVDGELILTRDNVELARFSTGDGDSPAIEPIAAPFALLGDVARAFAPTLRRDLHYSSVAARPSDADASQRYFLLGDNSPASLDSRFAAFGTLETDALLFRVAPTEGLDEIQ